MKVDRDYARETLVRLVRINSINPTLAPGAPGEREIAEYIAGSLRSAGLSVEIYEPAPGKDVPGGSGGKLSPGLRQERWVFSQASTSASPSPLPKSPVFPLVLV